MLDLSSEAMRTEIQAFSTRLRGLEDELRERGKLSDTNRAVLDQLQQHEDRLKEKFSKAETGGTWSSITEEFVEDWNSLVLETTALENRLYE